MNQMSATDRVVRTNVATNNYEACFLEHRKMTRQDFDNTVKPFNDARRLLSRPKEWATGAVIIFACFIMRKQLLVIDEKSGLLFCGTYLKNQSNSTFIFINWTNNRTHFEPLIRAKKNDQVIRLQFASDDPMVTKILNKYVRSCGWSPTMVLK